MPLFDRLPPPWRTKRSSSGQPTVVERLPVSLCHLSVRPSSVCCFICSARNLFDLRSVSLCLVLGLFAQTQPLTLDVGRIQRLAATPSIRFDAQIDLHKAVTHAPSAPNTLDLFFPLYLYCILLFIHSFYNICNGTLLCHLWQWQQQQLQQSSKSCHRFAFSQKFRFLIMFHLNNTDLYFNQSGEKKKIDWKRIV